VNWQLSVTPELPPIPYPAGLDAEAKQAWVKEWFWSEAGAPYRIWLGGSPQIMPDGRDFLNQHSWAVSVASDGTFHIPDLPPGKYTLSAWLFEEPQQRPPRQHLPPQVSLKFIVPDGTDLAGLPPLDVGELRTVPGSSAQISVPEPTRTEPVTARMQASRETLRAGDAFELLVRVRIAGEHHIYALNSAQKPFIPTTLKLVMPDGVEATEDWSAPQPGQGKDGEKIYTDTILFRRPMKLRTGVHDDKLSFSGELRYQACTGELCWPPGTIALSTTVSVQ
jgi:hypothetical protein